MNRVLVVEDSPTIAMMLKNRLENGLGWTADVAHSFQQAMLLLNAHSCDYSVALLDLSLPDAPTGAVVDPVLELGIPVIVFTGEYDDHIQDQMWGKRVAEYVIKAGQDAVDRIISVVMQLDRNPDIKVLVVDDSHVTLKHIVSLLHQHRYNVVCANNGRQALEMLGANPDVKLVITDCDMPEMDGFTLIREIRGKKNARELPILGMSAHDNKHMSAHFIKCGANDYISKPFSPDEFYCRISQNLEIARYVSEIQEAAFRDFLTGLRNRHYFWKFAPQACEDIRKNGKLTGLAVLDADFFKKVNDTHGHEAGDAVLEGIGKILSTHFSDGAILARFGGEEFSILFAVADAQSALQTMENVRMAVAAQMFRHHQRPISITISAGLCVSKVLPLEKMLDYADAAMYRAKDLGRNQCILVES